MKESPKIRPNNIYTHRVRKRVINPVVLEVSRSIDYVDMLYCTQDWRIYNPFLRELPLSGRAAV